MKNLTKKIFAIALALTMVGTAAPQKTDTYVNNGVLSVNAARPNHEHKFMHVRQRGCDAVYKCSCGQLQYKKNHVWEYSESYSTIRNNYVSYYEVYVCKYCLAYDYRLVQFHHI